MYNSGFYDTPLVKPVDNEILEVKLEDQLITRLNLENFAHADYSLTEEPGMVKKIRTYHGTGAVEELAMGQGNSDDFGAYWDEVEYRVGVTQGRAKYYDEQLMADPVVIDKLVQHMSEEMTNDMTRKIVGEMQKTDIKKFGATFGFDIVSDAISEFPDEKTEDEQLFMLIARKDSSAWRKALKDDLKYVEDFVRKGYIGTVCGVPIYWSDAVPEGRAFIGTREAITIFVKRGVQVEQERDANVRENKLYTRKVMLVALTNSDKLIDMCKAADPTTGYTLLVAEPANWATNYNDYYTIDPVNLTMVKNAFTEAPVFRPNHFYQA